MHRRTVLRTCAAAVGAAAAAGVASAADGDRASGETQDDDPSDGAGLVWSARDEGLGEETLLDVAPGTDTPFVACGYGRDGDDSRAVVKTTDRWGRTEHQRRGPDWGTRGDALLAHDDGYVYAGVDDGAPLLARLSTPLDQSWRHTFDGAPAGRVHAAAAGGTYALGWSSDDDGSEATVAATDATGAEQWTNTVELGRLTALLAVGPALGDNSTTEGTATGRTATDAPPAGRSLVAVGARGDRDVEGGWVAEWRPDGTRRFDRTLSLPGPPAAAASDEGGVVLAGTTDGGDLFLRRFRQDWTVDWTATYPHDGEDPTVTDLVVRHGAGESGFGLLAHDADGTVVVRTGLDGGEQWRGRYAPSPDEWAGANRGYALAAVANDEFVVAGASAEGPEGRDWWLARVGDPATATPADVPDPTPTPGPTTTPPPTPTATPIDAIPTTADPTDTRTATPHVDTDGPGTATPTATLHDESTGTGPGFGVGAALAGLAGLAGLERWRGEE